MEKKYLHVYKSIYRIDTYTYIWTPMFIYIYISIKVWTPFNLYGKEVFTYI